MACWLDWLVTCPASPVWRVIPGQECSGQLSGLSSSSLDRDSTGEDVFGWEGGLH